ncbi:Trehalase [Trichinella spiralis]|uniref:Trehalase n=1 Tax=Trichinella spiralis TaxID=6334 RepID=A0ABR3K7Q3_TRISP
MSQKDKKCLEYPLEILQQTVAICTALHDDHTHSTRRQQLLHDHTSQRKFGHPLSRDNHRPPVWRLLFSSMLPARIPAAAVAQCPLSISDDPWNHPRMPGMASLTCIAFVGIFAGSLRFQHKYKNTS